VRPTFGWYESVAYEEPGKGVRWLRLDEMMNAVMSFVVNTVGYMSGARPGLKAEDAGCEPGRYPRFRAVGGCPICTLPLLAT